MAQRKQKKKKLIDPVLEKNLAHALPILVRELAAKSFYDFFKTFWHIIAPTTHGHFNWHVKYICDELQKLAERVFADEERQYDLIINIPPGSTKTTICSIMFPAWVWTRKPDARLICASFTDVLAESFSQKTRMIIVSELYRQSFPQVKFARITRNCLFTASGGERRAIGVGGNITGQHAHFIIIDDPINPATAASEKGIQSVNEWMDQTISTRRIITNKVLTPTIMIMQRLHMIDPTGHWLERQGQAGAVKHICLPAEADEKNIIKPPALKQYYQDGLLDPVRLSQKELDLYKKKLGDWAYACQFDQSPIPRNSGFFVTKKIRCMNAPPMDSFVQLCRFWDKAATTGNRSDYTAGILMGRTYDDFFWILDVVRGQWNSADRERVMRETAERDGENVIIGLEKERASGGIDSLNMTIKNLAGFTVKTIPIGGDKGMRADPFSTQVNAGNVCCQIEEWNHDFLEELQYFPLGKYDDQVDAAGGAFKLVIAPQKPAQITCSEFSFV